jgi:hypothetical protein
MYAMLMQSPANATNVKKAAHANTNKEPRLDRALRVFRCNDLSAELDFGHPRIALFIEASLSS